MIHSGRPDSASVGSSGDLGRLLESTLTNDGVSVAEWSRRSPVLVVFLRHFGCTFCREALADLRAGRGGIERSGTRLLLVHMADDDLAAKFLSEYGLDDVTRVSDPGAALYRACGLERGTMGQILGWRVWWRGVTALVAGRHGIGRLVGDGLQMPGVFLLREGRVVRSFRHRHAGERPAYGALACERAL